MVRTIVADGEVAGNIGSWSHAEVIAPTDGIVELVFVLDAPG